MISAFKETIASIRDNHYGQVIIARQFKNVLWYWTKYVLLLTILPFFVGVFLLTRYLPELPKIITDNFPTGVLELKNNQLSSTVVQPFRLGDSNFSVILDLAGDPSELDSASAGAIIMKDHVVFKSLDTQTFTQDYSKLPNFSLEKNQVAKWVSANSFNLWLGGLLLLIVICLVSFAFSWIFRLSIYAVFAFILMITGKYFLKKNISYLQNLNIVLYASILPLILTLVFTLAPSNITDIFSTALFVYFCFTWIWNLPGENLPLVISSSALSPVSPAPLTLTKPSKSPTRRRKKKVL